INSFLTLIPRQSRFYPFPYTTLFRSGSGDEDQVDAHPPVLVEVTGPVVPPREQAVFVVALTKGVYQAPFLQLSEGLSLGLADVGGPLEARRVPEIAVLGSDVEIAADGHGCRRI